MARVLAVSAHPDDETIGAGGALIRHAALGDELYWCIFTQAYEPQWSSEFIANARRQVDRVSAFYGMRGVFRLSFPTMKLNTIPTIDLTSAISRVVAEVCPDVVYIPPPVDVNSDHRIVHESCLVATRPLPGSSVRRVLAYEISTTSRFLPEAFPLNVFVDITDYLEKKIEAMKCYGDEIRKFPHPRSSEGIRTIARERGLSVGFEAAECFYLVREII